MYVAVLSLGWPSSHQHSHLPVTARRGSLQLWQFLIALLEDPANCGAITWTGRGMEFKLIEPEEVSLELCETVDMELCKDFNI